MDIDRATVRVIRASMQATSMSMRVLSYRSGIPVRTLSEILSTRQRMKLWQAHAIASGLDMRAAQLVGDAQDLMDEAG